MLRRHDVRIPVRQPTKKKDLTENKKTGKICIGQRDLSASSDCVFCSLGNMDFRAYGPVAQQDRAVAS